MKRATEPREIECLEAGELVAALLHPLRVEVMHRAVEPRSAADIASELGHPRQRVNYHVRELERAGLLRRAGRRKKRNLYEQRYVATARSYVLSPELLGPLAADRRSFTDALSAATLLALAQRLSREVGRAVEEAHAQNKRLSTLSIDAELRFESAAQRESFTTALRDAIAQVVAKHSSPAEKPDGSPGKGRPYRLVVGCHPIPPNDPSAEKERSDDGREET